MDQPRGKRSVHPCRSGCEEAGEKDVDEEVAGAEVEVEVDGEVDEESERWISIIGIRLSDGVGFSDVPGTTFCDRLMSSSFFLKRGTWRLSRLSRFQRSEVARDEEGKQVQEAGRLGSLEESMCVLAFFGGKLRDCIRLSISVDV